MYMQQLLPPKSHKSPQITYTLVPSALRNEIYFETLMGNNFNISTKPIFLLIRVKAMDKTFGRLLMQLRNKANKSRYQLWKFSGIDQSYIAKLESGEKTCPSRATVILLGMGLLHNSDQIELSDIEELLLAADYAPLRKRDIAQEAKRRP